MIVSNDATTSSTVVEAERRVLELRRQAERLLRTPPTTFGAIGGVRRALEDLRSEALDELDVIDGRLRTVALQRREMVERIVACNRALVGTGLESAGGALAWRPSFQFADPLPDGDRRRLGGRELRPAVVAILQLIGQPLTIGEIERLLALHGVEPDRDPRRAIANALRNELTSGRIRKIARARYEYISSAPSDAAGRSCPR